MIWFGITSYFFFHETWWFFIKLYKNEFRFHQFLLLRVAMATSMLPHRTTIITAYKITQKAKLVDLIGLSNLKEKWVGLHLYKSNFMKESCFGQKLCSFKFLYASLIFMYIKNSLIFKYIKNKRLLTSVAKIRKVPLYFFYFLKDNGAYLCIFVASLLFTACLYQILEGTEFPTVLCNLKTISAN